MQYIPISNSIIGVMHIYIYRHIYIYTVGYLHLPVYTELGGAITKMPIKMCIFRCLELVRSIAMGHLGISHIGT